MDQSQGRTVNAGGSIEKASWSVEDRTRKLEVRSSGKNDLGQE